MTFLVEWSMRSWANSRTTILGVPIRWKISRDFRNRSTSVSPPRESWTATTSETQQRNISRMKNLLQKRFTAGSVVVDPCARKFSTGRAWMLLPQHRRFSGYDIGSNSVAAVEEGFVETYTLHFLKSDCNLTAFDYFMQTLQTFLLYREAIHARESPYIGLFHLDFQHYRLSLPISFISCAATMEALASIIRMKISLSFSGQKISRVPFFKWTSRRCWQGIAACKGCPAALPW